MIFRSASSTAPAVEANTERPTDSTILVRSIARVRTTGGNLHRLDLPDMNQIGLLEQQEELRRTSQQIHFLNGKGRGGAKRKKLYFQLLRRARRLRKRLLRDLESRHVIHPVDGERNADAVTTFLEYPAKRPLRGKAKIALRVGRLIELQDGQTLRSRNRRRGLCLETQ
jgi:hypothetical protein